MAPGVERSARLALDASSPEEVDSRLSALSELLKGLKVSGQSGIDGHPVERLLTFLKSKLPKEAHERINQAIKVLDDVRRLRNGGQHYGASHDPAAVLVRLGVGYPVLNWSIALRHIQRTVATAFYDLRDEIQASVEDQGCFLLAVTQQKPNIVGSCHAILFH